MPSLRRSRKVRAVRERTKQNGGRKEAAAIESQHASNAFIALNAVIFPDAKTGVWIAQGLEYDICAQAETLEGVQAAFERMLAATAVISKEHGHAPFGDIEPAPRKFWEMYRRAKNALPLRHPKLIPVLGGLPLKVVERIAA